MNKILNIAKKLITLCLVGSIALFLVANLPDTKEVWDEFFGNKLSFFVLSKITKEGLSDPELFKQMILAKVSYNRPFLFFLFLLFLGLIGLLALVKRKKEADKFEEILRKFDLVYEVQEQKDSKGNIRTKAEKICPKLKIKDKDVEEFIIEDIHPSKEKNLRAYLKGLLNELSSKEYITLNDGVIENTGRPGVFVVKLASKPQEDDELSKILIDVEYALIEPEKRDKNGVLTSLEIRNIPEIDFSPLAEGNNYFYINKVHPSVAKNIQPYLPGFLKKLQEIGKINIVEAVVEPTGLPGSFKVQLLDDDYKKRQRLEAVLFKARLFMEEKRGKDKVIVYPKVDFEESGDIILDATGTLLNRNTIASALGVFTTEYSPAEYSFVVPEGSNKFRIQKTKPADLLFSRGEAITSDFNKWENRGPVVKLKALWEKEKQFYWYFGSLKDSSLDLKDQDVILSGDNVVHPLLIGTSGSGKTEGLKSILMTVKHAYGHNVEIYLANGTPSPDLDPIAKLYSPMGFEAAKPEGEGAQKLVRLMNILVAADNIAKQRGKIFQDTYEKYGVECKKIVEYRKITGQDMPEIIIAIDEFAGYSIDINYDNNYNLAGSAAYYLQIAFSQFRKYGIHYILATQEAKAASVPRRLFSNINGMIIFRINGADKSYMESALNYDFEGRDPSTFAKGEGLFFGGEIRCDKTGASKIPIAMPWIGPDIMEFISKIGHEINQEDKSDYDDDLLNLSEKDLDFLRISKKNLQQLIEKCFLEREGWEVIRRENPNFRIINLYAQKNNKKIYIAFAESGDVLTDNFEERKERENPEEVDLRVYFISGKVEGDRLNKIKDKIYSDGSNIPALILIQSDYDMTLKEAHQLYQSKGEGNDKEVFGVLLNSLETKAKEINNKSVVELYKTNFNKNSINLNQLNSIRENEDSAKKGASFEDFFLTMEREAKFDTVHGKELSLKGIVNLKFANHKAEGGLDAFRFTDREKKTGIGFQLKNQMSKPVDPTIIDKMVKTKNLYESQGIVFEKFVLITTGKITAQARMEGEKLGFTIIDGDTLNKIIIGSRIDDKNLPRLINPINGDTCLDEKITPVIKSFGEIKKEEKSKPELTEDQKIKVEESKKDMEQSIQEKLENIKKNRLKFIEDRLKNGSLDKQASLEVKGIETAKSVVSLPGELIKSSKESASKLIEEVKMGASDLKGEKEPELDTSIEDTEISIETMGAPGAMKKRYDFANKCLERFQLIDDRYQSSKNIVVPKKEKRDFLAGCAVVRIDDDGIDIVNIRYNQSRQAGVELVRELNESAKILEKMGYVIKRKTIIVSGKVSKELQNHNGIEVYHEGRPFIDA